MPRARGSKEMGGKLRAPRSPGRSAFTSFASLARAVADTIASVSRIGWHVALVTAAGWIAATLAPAGCGDGPGLDGVGVSSLATSICDRLLDCGCLPIEDREDCQIGFAGGLTADSDLAYDDGCLQKWRRWVSTASCASPSLPGVGDVCPVYHGAVFEGMPCEYGGVFVTDCGPRLSCIAGTCVDPGGMSFGGLDEPCELIRRCDDGLACDEVGRCRALPGPGQPCPSGQCAEGSRCEVMGDFEAQPVCVAGAEIGERCMGHAECASFNCPAGFCEPSATVGDPCSDNLPCGPELFCSDGVCQDGNAFGFCGAFELVIDAF